MTSPESPAAVEAPALASVRSADGAEPSSRPVPVADRPSPGDHVFKWALTGAALAVPTLLLFLLYELSTGSRLAIDKFGLHFLVDSIWDPVAEQFGAYPLIFGTLLSSFLALLFAVPLSLGVAIYLTEFAPRALRQPVAFVIELLAAIPSVVYGLWGVFVLMPVLKMGGIDPVYFGVLFIINNAIGLVTPPVGTVLNVVCGIARIPMSGAIRGVVPFMVAQTVVMFLLVAFPEIVMLPLKWMTH